MISKRQEPNVVTYNTIIDGLYKKGEIDKELLHDMIFRKHHPDVTPFLLMGCARM
jgi:pentatricopeptide repeat protein